MKREIAGCTRCSIIDWCLQTLIIDTRMLFCAGSFLFSGRVGFAFSNDCGVARAYALRKRKVCTFSLQRLPIMTTSE